MSCAFFATGHTHAKKVQVLGARVVLTALRVFEKRVAAVDHDIARSQKRHELAQHLVYRFAGLDHHEHAPRSRQRVHEIVQGLCADNLAGAVLLDKPVHPFRFQIPHGHALAVIFDVERQVLAHDAEANNAELRRLCGRGCAHTNTPYAIFRAIADLRCSPCTSVSNRRRPCSMSPPRSMRIAQRPRCARDSESPSACASIKTPNVYGLPGMLTSRGSEAVSWIKTPLSGPPLCNWPVECRNRGPYPVVTAAPVCSRIATRSCCRSLSCASLSPMYCVIAT